jgi:hypothetical protein
VGDFSVGTLPKHTWIPGSKLGTEHYLKSALVPPSRDRMRYVLRVTRYALCNACYAMSRNTFEVLRGSLVLTVIEGLCDNIKVEVSESRLNSDDRRTVLISTHP